MVFIKKIGFAVMLTALTVVVAQSQTITPSKHQCTTEQCSKSKHVYKHGEEQHKCDDSCKVKSTTMELKNHQCTDACRNAAQCVFAHGEKGHSCNDNCKPVK